jgi:hypothetical protein
VRGCHYATGAWSDRAGLNRRWHLGKVLCYRYTTVTWSLRPVLTRDLFRTEEALFR